MKFENKPLFDILNDSKTSDKEKLPLLEATLQKLELEAAQFYQTEQSKSDFENQLRINGYKAQEKFLNDMLKLDGLNAEQIKTVNSELEENRESILTEEADHSHKIERRKVIEIKDNNWHTLVWHAVSLGLTDCAQFFIAKGADITVVCPKSPFSGYTMLPITIAAENGKKDCVKLLIEAHKKLLAKEQAETKLESSEQKDLLPNSKRRKLIYQFDKALISAAAYNHLDIVKLLIAEGADVNAEYYNKIPVAFVAAGNGNSEILKLLSKSGADIHKIYDGDSVDHPTNIIQYTNDRMQNAQRTGQSVDGFHKCIEILLNYKKASDHSKREKIKAMREEPSESEEEERITSYGTAYESSEDESPSDSSAIAKAVNARTVVSSTVEEKKLSPKATFFKPQPAPIPIRHESSSVTAWNETKHEVYRAYQNKIFHAASVTIGIGFCAAGYLTGSNAMTAAGAGYIAAPIVEDIGQHIYKKLF